MTVPGAIRPALLKREQRRRAVVLLAVAAALVLSVSPVIGHHLIGATPWFPGSQQHLAALCLVALHLMIAPLHSLFHGLLYAGLAYASIDRLRALLRQRRLFRDLRTTIPDPGSAIAAAARGAFLRAEQVRVVVGSPNPAFTAGWWHPRVFVAADLPSRLTAEELEAVLAHEAVHVRRRDPLRLFLLRSLAALLFWLPALNRLAADLADEWEVTADDEAARGRGLALASAILRLAGGSSDTPEPTVGFQRLDLLPRRIRRLAGEDADLGTHVSRGSIAMAATALAAVWLSGLMVLHPLTPDTMTSGGSHHCDHPGRTALTHLLCRGWDGVPGDDRCPHDDPVAGGARD